MTLQAGVEAPSFAPDRTWRDCLEARHGRHRDLLRLPATIAVDPRTRAALGRSLSVFQVGESGTGEHLIAAARRRHASDDYVVALQCFVREEQEHARLLALAVEGLDRPLRQGHWTDRVFVGLRRLRSLRTEVLTLLVAELIALTYYARLRDADHDPVLTDILGRIQADEVVHVDFHAETFPTHLAGLSRTTLRFVRFVWSAVVAVTSVLVAVDHRAALRASGVSTAEFVRSVQEDRRALAARLFD